jgi:hypothetical protein
MSDVIRPSPYLRDGLGHNVFRWEAVCAAVVIENDFRQRLGETVPYGWL